MGPCLMLQGSTKLGKKTLTLLKLAFYHLVILILMFVT